MGGERTQAEVFLAQAAQAAGRSPLYAGLCERFAHDPAVAAIIGSSPRWDDPLRLLAGLHRLVLSGRASWDGVDEALATQRRYLRAFVAGTPVQTNEVQRCWSLLPVFLEVARRTGATVLDLVELGPAAGLNLLWDRYRYRYRDGSWGEAGARLELAGEERRPVPAALLARRPRVRSRTGIDLAPVDVTKPEGALLLRSFVWGDQDWRLDLLDRAIASLRASPPPRLVRGDVAEVLPRLLRGRPGDGLTLVWQTAVLGYLPRDRRRLVTDALAEAGREAPLAFVEATRPEGTSEVCWGVTIELWPGGGPEQVALVDFHGAWIDWLA